MNSNLNPVAIIVGAVAHWVWGAIWYMLLGSTWMAAVGKHAAQNDPMPYVISFIALLVAAFVLADFLRRMGVQTLASGARMGAMVGVGFVAAFLAVNYAYQARPIVMWWIDGLYAVIGMAITGAIIGGWKKKG